MSNALTYRALVPDAPLHRRTEGDGFRDELFLSRVKSNKILLDWGNIPGLQEPSLISSFDGAIERILFCFPAWAVADPDSVNAYRSLIGALRAGTKFVIVHHESVQQQIESWFTSVGHNAEHVLFVGMPDYVNMTDWAEDAYVALVDKADQSTYLMEPWEFKRAGDALIADAVDEMSDIRSSQSPLIFQGGNCLVGSNFWMLGKDYFVDTTKLVQGDRPPVTMRPETDVGDFATKLFKKYVDKERALIQIGTKKPIPSREYIGTLSEGTYYIDIAGGGVGTFQPIFHIDMFISLVGENNQGKFTVLVGSPAMADQILETKSPFSLNAVYDSIADSLAALGFAVVRNPLVHRPKTGKSLPFSDLRQIAAQPENARLIDAVKELASLGAADNTQVKIRDWHHITWNNCLVENSKSKGKHVYLPSYGFGRNSDLKILDEKMKHIWEGLGFEAHALGDFNKFAERQGVVHCIKKYLGRGD